MLKQDHYALLGIAREADAEAIERACAGALSVTSDSAERARLRHAREVLTSPRRRTTYDRSLRTIPRPPQGIGTRSHKATQPGASANRLWLGLGGMATLALVVGGLSYVYWFSKPKAAIVPAAGTALPATATYLKATTKPAGSGGPESRRQTAANNSASNVSVSPETVYANAAPSVLAIESLNTSGVAASKGSAVVIGRELVVTDCHLVRYAAAVRVRAGNREFTAMPDTADNTLDLCLLRVPGLTAPPALRGSIDQVGVGQTVVAIGASQGQERLVSQGQVSALPVNEGITVIQTSATIAPGASGGGLFDAEGRLIGITTDQHAPGSRQSLVLPVDLLNSLRNR